MQQAYLIGHREAHDRQIAGVDAAIVDLLTIIPDLELFDARVVRAVVKEVRDEGMQLFSPPDDWLATLDAAEDEYHQTPGDENAAENICKQLIANIVRPLVDRVSGVLLANFKNRSDRRYFELGELLDQGIRRPDTYRFMHSFGPWPSLTDTPSVAYSADQEEPESESECDSGSEDDSEDGSGPTYTKWEIGDARINDVVDADRLIGIERAVGDLAPEQSWTAEMDASWRRAKLTPATLNEAVRGISRSMIKADLLDVISRLDAAAKSEIEKATSTSVVVAPPQFKYGPVRCSKARLTIALGESKRSGIVTKLLWNEHMPSGTIWQRPNADSKARTHEYFFSEEQTFQQVKTAIEDYKRPSRHSD